MTLQVESLSIRFGKAFHRLLEFADQIPLSSSAPPNWRSGRWGAVLAPFALSASDCGQVGSAASRVVSDPSLRSLLGLDNPEAIAWVEREWPDGQGGWIRPDRVVWLPPPQAMRIIDFKWRVLPAEEADYAAQLRAYQACVSPAADGLIITAEGGHWILTQEGLVHWPSAGRPAL